MTTKEENKKAMKDLESKKVGFAVKPKTQSYRAFEFTGLDCMADLISFTGGMLPAINADLSLKIKKFTIKENNIILMMGDKIVNVVANKKELEEKFEIFN